MPSRASTSLALGLLAAGGLGYANWESRAYTLRRLDVPGVLPAGADPLRVLHLSDLHLSADEHRKQEWIRELARFSPDFVALTGDVLAAADAVPAAVHALEPLFAVPGAFVPGNNDYYAPIVKNPLRYFTPRGEHDFTGRPRLPWLDVAAALAAEGWLDLTNRRTTTKLAGLTVELAGVDDPYLRRDRYGAIGGPVDPAADGHLALLHVPEPRLLDRFAADGFGLLLAGHTHGGQVRIPGIGAVVTNCGIDRARARGLSRYAETWLHVSAGLGTSPYAPIRFACRPEATLLTLTG